MSSPSRDKVLSLSKSAAARADSARIVGVFDVNFSAPQDILETCNNNRKG